MDKISSRLLEIVDALPLKKGMRVLEIGCGPGVAAREIARRIGDGKVLAIDRSAKAIQLAIKNSQEELRQGVLEFLQADVERFVLPAGEGLYDIAFAVRVGILDGRHPEKELAAVRCIKQSLKRNGRLFIDGGHPLREVKL